jgi:hypothetical protein
MMLRRAFLTGSLALLVVPALVVGHGNERGVITAQLGGGKLTIEHGRPMAKGRDVMSLIKPGSYWRMGADAATTLTTEVDLMVGGQRVPKGKYTLLAHFLEGGKWSLVVAEGATLPSWQPTKVVGEVGGSVEKIDPVEVLTIKLETQGSKGKVTVEWGASRLSAEFTAA